MFDLRYHVASLAAVFLALIIGILVGVGMSGSGLVRDSERRALNDQIDRLQHDLDAERQRSREQEAAGAFADSAYAAVMARRLADKRIAVVYFGAVDNAVNAAVEQAIRDAGGRLVRLRAIALPDRMATVTRGLARHGSLADYSGSRKSWNLGRDLGRELVAGGDTPLWEAVSETLVAQRSGSGRPPADGVVLARSIGPQHGQAARFLGGFASGLRHAATVVGVESTGAKPSAIPIYTREGFSSVDDVDTSIGKVALAVLLSGGQPGQYGLKQTAEQAIPPIDPVPAQSPGGG